jgi:biotin synthase
MKHTIDRLCSQHSLDRQEYLELLQCNDVDTLDYLRFQAQKATLERFGRDVYVRGLIEITNECRNNCLY